nr:immunoglobulin light chain junction region [Macaca mulatta]
DYYCMTWHDNAWVF